MINPCPVIIHSVSTPFRVLQGLLLVLSGLFLACCGSGDSTRAMREPQVHSEAPTKKRQVPSERPNELTHVQFLSRTHWVVTDFKSIWKTEDAGVSWQRSLGPLEQKEGRDLSGGLSFINKEIGFAVLGHKVFGSVDGGNTWTYLSDPDIATRNIFFVDAKNGWGAGMEWTDDPAESRKLLYTGRLWHTQDGGQTWHEQRLPKTSMDNHADRWDLKDVFFSDARNGWAVGNGVFLHSEDGGTTWKELSIRGDFSRIIFADGKLGWAVHRESGMFELTHDGGKSWKHIEGLNQNDQAQVVFVTPKDGFAIQRSVILVATADGGQGWKAVTLPDHVLSSLQTATDIDSSIGRALDGTLVSLWLTGKPKDILSAISTDGGQSWR